MKKALSKTLQITATILMGGVAAFDIVGGIGTICAAFFTKDYPPLWPLLGYQWIYQIFVFVTLAFGFLGIWVTIALVRKTEHAYRNTLLVLAAGVVFYTIRVYTSLYLRGKAAPTNINWYFHMIVLAVFLLFRLPGLRQHAFKDPDDQVMNGVSGGLTSIVVGIFLAFSTQWVAASHTFQGVNWADVIKGQLIIVGAGFILGGAAVLAVNGYRLFANKVQIDQNNHQMDLVDIQ